MDRENAQLVTRIAKTDADLRAAERLRFKVFIEELGGDGALVDHENRLEKDRFDPYCDHLVLIDTTSATPYAGRDMVRLTAFAEAAEVDRVLVMNAGRDAGDAAEIAAAFGALAPRRMLVTGLDMTRRLGSLLAAADACQAAFSDISETPEILDGLRPANPVALARLFLERADLPGATAGSQANGQHGQSTSWN